MLELVINLEKILLTKFKTFFLIATYSILPFDAGLYFNKIQCFCFEEQRLDPNEEVDMPVFFYIDEQVNNNF